jgi:hypothetical protein
MDGGHIKNKCHCPLFAFGILIKHDLNLNTQLATFHCSYLIYLNFDGCCAVNA